MMTTTTHEVHVAARRWFQRTYGNTYHTVAVYLDGELVGISDRTYGYGEHFLHTAGTILAEYGLLAELTDSDDPYSLHTRTVRERGHELTIHAEDVQRRKNLHDPADYEGVYHEAVPAEHEHGDGADSYTHSHPFGMADHTHGGDA